MGAGFNRSQRANSLSTRYYTSSNDLEAEQELNSKILAIENKIKRASDLKLN